MVALVLLVLGVRKDPPRAARDMMIESPSLIYYGTAAAETAGYGRVRFTVRFDWTPTMLTEGVRRHWVAAGLTKVINRYW